MKQLPIKNVHYNYLEKSFKEWLNTLGYAEVTVVSFPIHLREFFHYLEEKNVQHITAVKARHINGFIQYLQIRSNQKQGGGLSSSTINKTIQSINTFARYINQSGKHILDLTAKRIENSLSERTVLTQLEIKKLYEASFTPHRQNTLAIGQRDRAIIAIFYGCGLRKSEGAALDLRDIDLVKRTVFVRKGKGNKQRYVPIALKHADDIRSYIEEGRYWFLEDHTQTNYKHRQRKDSDSLAFFLSMGGKRMKSFYARFDYLRDKSGIEKKFSTHSLRHSIATHLLQSGMDIEEIAKFLGHSSLESTQIYTHIITKLKNEEYEFTGV